MAKDNKNKDNSIVNYDAKEFAKADFKKYKKHSGDYFDSKKEAKASYMQYLIELLPKTIEFVVKYGYINKPEVQETKTAIFAKFTNPEFVKVLKKEIDRGNKIENIKLMPIIIKELLQEGKKVNDQRLAEDPNAKIYDLTDLVELSKMIMKKKLKKFEKAGINLNLAFDLLSIIPKDEVLKSSQYYRVHAFYDCMYEHAKSVTVPVAQIMEIMVGEGYYPLFITFALLERKEKFTKLTDAQKQLYLEISNWCFNVMEKDMKKEDIESIIKFYISGRKKDESQGRDGNRRYALDSLSETDYPRIKKVLATMVSKDDTIKKYL